MKPRALKVKEGTQIVRLSDCNLFKFYLEFVEFLTDADNYSLSLQKIGIHGMMDRYSTIYRKGDGKIPIYYFQQFRDGMTQITINSSCNGVLYFYFVDPPSYQKNPIEKARQEMEDKSIAKHYIKFIKNYGNFIFIDEDFYNNYCYDRKYKELHQICDRDNARLYHTKNNEHIVTRLQDILTGFEIDSTDDCTCSIEVGYMPLFKLKIKKEKHFYPFKIILNCLQYHIVSLNFEVDCIKSIRQQGFGIHEYIKNLLQKSVMISKEQNVEVVYNMGMMAICNSENIPTYDFLKENSKPLTFAKFKEINPSWNSFF